MEYIKQEKTFIFLLRMRLQHLYIPYSVIEGCKVAIYKKSSLSMHVLGKG